MSSIGNIKTVCKRELKSYFESPVAYVFMIVFLVLSGFLTFGWSKLYERQAADLDPFFQWHPLIFLILVSAATMSLWAEERRAGTIELLLTMPITLFQAIIGKFFAAWFFMLIVLALTFPVVLTVALLGNPDAGVIACGYFGSALLAAAYVSVGMLTSSLTRSQVIGFVLSFSICIVLLLAGWPPITDFLVNWAPNWLVNAISAFSFMPHFESIQRGIVELRSIAYYLSVVAFMTMATYIVLDNRKSA